jgi:hypothetical protein
LFFSFCIFLFFPLIFRAQAISVKHLTPTKKYDRICYYIIQMNLQYIRHI